VRLLDPDLTRTHALVGERLVAACAIVLQANSTCLTNVNGAPLRGTAALAQVTLGMRCLGFRRFSTDAAQVVRLQCPMRPQ